MVDQGSGAKIMYSDLYNGLNLRPKDLTAYDSPLVSFDGKVVISKGQIRLLVQAGSEVVEVDFIVVDAYSPFMAIVARPWLHALGVVFLLCTRRWNIRQGVKLKRLLEVNPPLDSACWLPYYISLKLSP